MSAHLNPSSNVRPCESAQDDVSMSKQHSKYEVLVANKHPAGFYQCCCCCGALCPYAVANGRDHIDDKLGITNVSSTRDNCDDMTVEMLLVSTVTLALSTCWPC